VESAIGGCGDLSNLRADSEAQTRSSSGAMLDVSQRDRAGHQGFTNDAHRMRISGMPIRNGVSQSSPPEHPRPGEKTLLGATS